MNPTYIDIISYIAAIILSLFANFLVSFYAAGKAMGQYEEKFKHLEREYAKIDVLADRLAYVEGKMNGRH